MPSCSLSTWLKHSTAVVPARDLARLAPRLERHAPGTYKALQKALEQEGIMRLLHSRIETVNPALLICVHVSSVYGSAGAQRFLPPCNSEAAPPAPTVHQKGRLVGEVWWIRPKETGKLCLAEAFDLLDMPAGRLPHMDPAAKSKTHVIRILGSNRSHIRGATVADRVCIFSEWCAPNFRVTT